MAGLEVVGRQVVFPNIRPQPPQKPIPPAEDPESGFCVIRGNGAKHITLTYNFSVSASKSIATETERRVTRQRVYQKEENGNINKENYVDVQVANRIKLKGTAFEQASEGDDFNRFKLVRQEGLTRFYQRASEADNVKNLRTDEIIKTDPSTD